MNNFIGTLLAISSHCIVLSCIDSLLKQEYSLYEPLCMYSLRTSLSLHGIAYIVHMSTYSICRKFSIRRKKEENNNPSGENYSLGKKREIFLTFFSNPREVFLKLRDKKNSLGIHLLDNETQ